MLNILIIGKSGQLGSSFHALSQASPESCSTPILKNLHIEVIGRPDIDITHHKHIQDTITAKKPDIVINASAYTAVDDAETNEARAFEINALAPKNLASICRKQSIPFIHISTDYVFDGSNESPYLPNDQTAPQNAYGRTKLSGEWACRAEHPDGAYIIRTSWVFSQWGNNFVKTMLNLAKSHSELNIVSDQFGAPTYAPDLAIACLHIAQNITSGKVSAPDTYHVTNTGFCSWHEFAKGILKAQTVTVNKTSSASFPRPAKRPQYSKLCTANTQDQFQLKLRPWQEALTDCMKQLNAF